MPDYCQTAPFPSSSSHSKTIESKITPNKKKKIVMKFGGTSVGSIDRIRAAANLIKREVDAGNDVAVVVSAMAGVTNTLTGQCLEFSDRPDPHEYATVVTAGEQISSGLLALALQNQGVRARSFQGWQIPVSVDYAKNGAVSFSVDSTPLEACFLEEEVPIVSGFQGIDHQQRIATLGRGGSDATAVAVSAALKADQCDIYTDVEGIYSGDPRIVPRAQLLSEITFEEMLEFAQNGAKVLQPLSVSMAMAENVPVRVLSSFVPPRSEAGTRIVQKKPRAGRIVGVSTASDKAIVILCGCSPSLEEQDNVLRELEESGIQVEASILECEEGKIENWHLFMRKEDAFLAGDIVRHCLKWVSRDSIEISTGISKVAAIGQGLLEDKCFLDIFAEALNENGITSFTLLSDNLKIFAFTPQEISSAIIRSLHTKYGLDKKEVSAA